MGSFFTNVHVRIPEEGEDATRKAIVDALTADAGARGMALCSEGDKPDRSIVLLGKAGWIGVFDEETENQHMEALDRLASVASAASRGPAVGALVHDSDHLFLRLFDRGEKVDEVEADRKLRSDLAKWSVVCGDKLADLRAALTRRDLLKEQTLADVAGILGIEPSYACTGYRYITEGSLPAEAIVLRLRSVVRPAHETPASGPPRFQHFPIGRPEEVSVGNEWRHNVMVYSIGGPSRGLAVAVHGPLIEESYVTPERVAVRVGLPSKERGDLERSPERRTLKNGRPGLVAEWPDLELPAGIGGDGSAARAMPPRDYAERMFATAVNVTVCGRAQALGKGQVHVTVVPLAAREAQVHHTTEVTVVPVPRKPLRAVAGIEALLPLARPQVLLAVAVSTLDAATAAPIAADAVERWSALWSRDLVLSCSIHEAMSTTRPARAKTAKLGIEKMLKGAAWKKLRAAFATAPRVSGMNLATPKDAAELVRRGGLRGDGFDFGGTYVGPRDPDDPELPTLRLAVDLTNVQDVGAALEQARSIVDDFIASARGVQAFVARWGTGGTLDTTPYESVCGIHQAATLRRSWATRFLRGVDADGLWLGPDLLARIDRQALDAVTSSAQVGEALRVQPREGAGLDALETVLAPVLASGEDWQRWMKWIYGHGPNPM